MKKRLNLICLLVSVYSVSYAQLDTIRNPLSIEPIAYYEQLYRFRVDRIIDLNERQNAGFKSRQSDIAKFLVEAIKGGKLNVYGDSLTRGLVQTVSTTLISNQAVMSPAWDAKQAYQTTENVSVNGVNYSSLRNDNTGHSPSDAAWWEKSTEQTEFVGPEQIQGLKLVEDVIFDKRRSRLFYDIQAIGIMAQPQGDAELQTRGYVLYKDFYSLVEAYAHSKNLAERDMVMWRNRYNPSENKTFTDAFKIRMFHGVIEKVENPDDRNIVEIFRTNNRSFTEAIYARWEEEMKMMEKEHNLWEY
jgi:gliding motility associated protien GldN